MTLLIITNDYNLPPKKEPPKKEPSKKESPKKESPKKPSPIKRVVHYTQALFDWVAKGLPDRTQEEVENILSTYCKPCEHYKDGICNVCGCKVNNLGIAILNKIKMQSQHCAKGLW